MKTKRGDFVQKIFPNIVAKNIKGSEHLTTIYKSIYKSITSIKLR